MKITQLPSYPPPKTLKYLDKVARDESISIVVDEKIAAMLPGSFVPISPHIQKILKPVDGLMPDAASLFGSSDLAPYDKFARKQIEKLVTNQLKSAFPEAKPYIDGATLLISTKDTYKKWTKAGEGGYVEPALATLKTTTDLLAFLARYFPQFKSLEPAAVTISLVLRVVSDGHRLVTTAIEKPEQLPATSHVMLMGYALANSAKK